MVIFFLGVGFGVFVVGVVVGMDWFEEFVVECIVVVGYECFFCCWF